MALPCEHCQTVVQDLDDGFVPYELDRTRHTPERCRDVLSARVKLLRRSRWPRTAPEGIVVWNTASGLDATLEAPTEDHERWYSLRYVRADGPAEPGDASEIRRLSNAGLLRALANVGCHLSTCDACAEVFFTGSRMTEHTCKAAVAS